MTARWDPDRYLRFADQRLRPGLDLLAAIPLVDPSTVIDLGCGPGNLTAALGRRWPGARITGLDASDDMLAMARRTVPDGTEWRRGDIADWSADPPVDLAFSNAALHWLPDHEDLFPRLFAQVGPGGVLAVQMPRNVDAPSHRLLHEVADALGESDAVPLADAPVAAPEAYYRLLAGDAETVDIWETTYLQVMQGVDPVFHWVQGTALRPVHAALEGARLERFLDTYARRLREAYPRRADGRTLFPFRRLFIVATRA